MSEELFVSQSAPTLAGIRQEICLLPSLSIMK